MVANTVSASTAINHALFTSLCRACAVCVSMLFVPLRNGGQHHCQAIGFCWWYRFRRPIGLFPRRPWQPARKMNSFRALQYLSLNLPLFKRCPARLADVTTFRTGVCGRQRPTVWPARLHPFNARPIPCSTHHTSRQLTGVSQVCCPRTPSIPVATTKR